MTCVKQKTRKKFASISEMQCSFNSKFLNHLTRIEFNMLENISQRNYPKNFDNREIHTNILNYIE